MGLGMAIDPVVLLGANGAIAKRLPGYEVRPEQLQMAKAIAHAIESKAHLRVEAGTGVGKSFGYLVPAILAATELGKKIVVSTRTINLQEQLIGKFDFSRQVTLYLVKGLPDPASESKVFESAAIDVIPKFIQKTRGKALVLFTSHQMMEAATRTLAPWFQREKIMLLSQRLWHFTR